MIASASTPEPAFNLTSESMAPPVDNAALLDRLADVQLPAEPQLWPVIIAAVIALIVIALIYFGYRRVKQHAAATTSDTTQQALARLTKLEQAWSSGELETREAAYQLSTLLRLGLNLPQLTRHSPPPLANQQTEWQQTITLFNQLRYQPQAAGQLTTDTFAQLRQWLKRSRHVTRDEPHV